MRFVRNIKVRLIGGFLTVALLGAQGCMHPALGLQDYQRDLLFGFGSLAIALLKPGAPAPQPEPALNCWDLNGNNVADPEEDINGDGVWDAYDCQGAPGSDGEPAQTVPGEPGEPGLNCWDLNGNNVADPEEDVNGDGVWDAYDCQGPAGSDGADGATGPAGPPGQPGASADAYFDLFIDDFFTITSGDAPMGSLPEVVAFEEPKLMMHGGLFDIGVEPVVAFRAAVPTTYTEGNLVTLRLFLFRQVIGEGNSECAMMRLDARRLRNGGGVEVYTGTAAGDTGTRFIRVTGGNQQMIVIDLPLNAPGGMDYANDLKPGDFLAFELNAMLNDDYLFFADGAEYLILGAELFESAAAGMDTATVAGTTLFLSEPDLDAGCDSCTADSDEDGVVDCLDLCPESAGEVNGDGCPIEQPELQ